MSAVNGRSGKKKKSSKTSGQGTTRQHDSGTGGPRGGNGKKSGAAGPAAPTKRGRPAPEKAKAETPASIVSPLLNAPEEQMDRIFQTALEGARAFHGAPGPSASGPLSSEPTRPSDARNPPRHGLGGSGAQTGGRGAGRSRNPPADPSTRMQFGGGASSSPNPTPAHVDEVKSSEPADAARTAPANLPQGVAPLPAGSRTDAGGDGAEPTDVAEATGARLTAATDAKAISGSGAPAGAVIKGADIMARLGGDKAVGDLVTALKVRIKGVDEALDAERTTAAVRSMSAIISRGGLNSRALAIKAIRETPRTAVVGNDDLNIELCDFATTAAVVNIIVSTVVTDRASYFKQVRDLAKAASDLGCVILYEEPKQPGPQNLPEGKIHDDNVMSMFDSINGKTAEKAVREDMMRRRKLEKQLRDNNMAEEADQVKNYDTHVVRHALKEAHLRLQVQLSKILVKVAANDPRVLVTPRELALLHKHEGWLRKLMAGSAEDLPEFSDDSYGVGDGSVDYARVFAVLVNRTKIREIDGAANQFAAAVDTIRCVCELMSEGSTSQARDMLNHERVTIGTGRSSLSPILDLIPQGLFDPNAEIHTPPWVLTFQRVMRLGGVLCKDLITVYAPLSLGLTERVDALIEQWCREAEAAEAVRRANFTNDRAGQVSPTESMLYLIIAGRAQVFANIFTARGVDVHVPALKGDDP